MNAPAINETKVLKFLTGLFEDDLHARRILSLAHVTLGVVHAASLSIHAIGRAAAAARGTLPRHAVKQADRFLSNDSVNIWQLAESWIPFVLADRAEAIITIDWTDFAKDDQTTLVASLVTTHGRATPLLWVTTEKSSLKGLRSQYEDGLLQRLKETIPPGVKVIILADRGFGDSKLYALLREFGFDYVVRFADKTQVKDAAGEPKRAAFWVPKGGRTLMLKNVSITEREMPVPAFVATKKPKMKEAWCLATSLSSLTATQVVKLYGRRFTIEESFRDIKDIRFGMGLSATHIGTPERRDRLLLVSALAIALLTLLGAAGEAAGIDRYWKVNTSKERQHSLFRQGCMYYEAIPNMRESLLLPLLDKFAELVRAQRTFREALGLI